MGRLTEGSDAATKPRYDVSRVTGFVRVRCTLPDGRTGAADGYSEGKARDEALAIALSQEPPAATLYRRKPDTVEAIQWNPSDADAMQVALTWLRESGEVFTTVGRQIWVEYGERGEQFVVHPGDYLIRKTEGRRFFYAESESKFKESREPVT